MKRILSILMLVALFVSCSSDDDNDSNGGKKDNDKGMIDEKIIGKWKVEYSKTIKPVRFLEDGTLEIPEGAVTSLYEGNWGEPGVIPESGMFDRQEIRIEIQKENKIIVSIGGGNPKDIICQTENNKLKWQTAKDNPTAITKYYFEGDNLVIELIGAEGTMRPLDYHTISKYSKITE